MKDFNEDISNNENSEIDLEAFRNISEEPTETEDCNIDNKVTEYILKPSVQINQITQNISLDELNESFSETPSNKENLKRIESNLLQSDNLSEVSDSVYGIRTNINAVSEYLDLLVKHLLTNYVEYLTEKYTQIKLEENENFLFGFEANLKLKYKKIETKIEVNELDATGDVWKRKTNKDLVLGEQIYLGLENKILSSYENMNINPTLFNMQKIYHRCIFDSFNEILSKLIKKEENFDLTLEERNIFKDVYLPPNSIELILSKTQYLLLDNVKEQCGIIKDKEDSLLDSIIKIIEPEK